MLKFVWSVRLTNRLHRILEMKLSNGLRTPRVGLAAFAISHGFITWSGCGWNKIEIGASGIEYGMELKGGVWNGVGMVSVCVVSVERKEWIWSWCELIQIVFEVFPGRRWKYIAWNIRFVVAASPRCFSGHSGKFKRFCLRHHVDAPCSQYVVNFLTLTGRAPEDSEQHLILNSLSNKQIDLKKSFKIFTRKMVVYCQSKFHINSLIQLLITTYKYLDYNYF